MFGRVGMLSELCLRCNASSTPQTASPLSSCLPLQASQCLVFLRGLNSNFDRFTGLTNIRLTNLSSVKRTFDTLRHRMDPSPPPPADKSSKPPPIQVESRRILRTCPSPCASRPACNKHRPYCEESRQHPDDCDPVLLVES